MMEEIKFLEYDELEKDIERLISEIPILIGERDELILVTCENIKAKYMIAVGGLEYKLYELDILCRRLKRKVQLIQASLNRQERVDVDSIESMLDDEMKEYQAVLDTKIKALNSALARFKEGKSLSSKEKEELKTLYHTIVKALHPDINPNISDDERELFLRAVDAYKRGDLDVLRLISATLSERTESNGKKTYAELVRERDQLFITMNKIREEIERIKETFPYNAKDFLADKEAVAQRKLELEGAIFDRKQIVNSLNEKIKEMTK